MAEITKTDMTGSGSRVVEVTTLGDSDTFTYKKGANATLILSNDTGGALTPNITGDGPASYSVAGIGVIDVSGGYDMPSSIADGVEVSIPLDSIRVAARLGTVNTITGGDGLTAKLLEYA